MLLYLAARVARASGDDVALVAVHVDYGNRAASAREAAFAAAYRPAERIFSARVL